ncbi:uncharacterized protein rab44 isoform X2 [Lates calcarifer]|uniref:Uncharacterized protein rab44 isoform X2 n=1 Tax=Lates calcarifer TaxID=8187 RepID=A0AAJ7PXL9_LATCA|nr:uncharacterized protein rab44 isoform X2 [Lates calcarifer]
MSAQRTKKKRLGSRRWVANQNEIPNADEFPVMDSTSVAQRHTPDGDNESLSLSSNPDSSQSETQHPPSPDLTLNRRKLGSRRKNKERQHVRDSALEAREEVEDNNWDNEALETAQISLTVQSERQEVCQGSEDNISATHDNSLNSATAPGYSSEDQNPTTTNCPEDVLEIVIPKNGNQQAHKDENETDSKAISYSFKLVETKFEVTDNSDVLQSEEVKENAHLVSNSDLTSLNVLSCSAVDQQLIDQLNTRQVTEEFTSVHSASEKENRERDEGLLGQDVNLQGNYLVSESHVESEVIGFSTTAEITTDKNSNRQNIKCESSVEQVTFSIPTEELTENQTEQFSLPLDSESQTTSVSMEKQIDTDFNPTVNRRKLGSRRKNKGQQHVKDCVAEEEVVENVIGNDASETTKMPLLIETAVQIKSVETMLEGMEKSDTQLSGQVKETAHLVGISELNSSTLHPAPSVDQQLSSVREMPDEEPLSMFSVTYAESKERDKDTELLKEWGILQANNLVSESHVKSDSVESLMTPEISTEKNSMGEHTEPERSAERMTVSSPKEELLHSSSSEVRGNQHSEDAVSKVHVEEVNPTEMQADYSSESLIHSAMSEIYFPNLTDQAEVSDTYQSDLNVTSVDDSATTQEVSNPDDKQDEHPKKESNVEAFDQIHENYHVYETKKPQTSDMEGADTSLGQVYEAEGQLENDIKSASEQTSHQEREGLLSEMEESKTSLQSLQSETNAPLDSQPQDNSVKIDEQNDTDFNPIGNRRKLGSSRRNKRQQQVKGSVAESHHKPTEDVVGKSRNDEPLETTKMSLMIKTAVQEISMEGKNQFVPSQTEEVSDEVKENALVRTSELTSISLQVDQQVIDQSNIRRMADEEPSCVYSVTDSGNKERDEDTDMLKQWGILQANNLVSGSHDKSDYIRSPMTLQISTEKSSPGQHKETKRSVEQATVSSPKEKLSTNNEQNEHSSSSEVRGTQHSEDAVNEVHVEEVNPTEMQEIHLIAYSSESGIHDTTENSEIFTNLTDRTEVSDTYQSELSVTSVDDSATTQTEVSNPDDEQDEHPTKESNVEAFDQINEYYHVNETKKPQTTDTERADASLGQVYEGEGQLENDIKSTAEQTSHQEKEGLLSEMEESKASLQSLQSETNAPLESQDTNTVINPIGNRRKLGSSRRKKGREHVKDSISELHHEPTEEDVDDIKGNEAFKTRSLTSLTTSQEELTQEREHDIMSVTYDNSLYPASTPDYSSEVQNPTTTNYLGTDPESLIPKSENLQEVHDERETDFKVGESDQLVDATLEGMDESDTLQSEEDNSTLYSEDTLNEVHEQEVNPTQIQKSHESDSFFESVIHTTAENADTYYGNLRDHEEVRDKHQPDLIVKSIDDPVTKQEVSDPDDTQDEYHTKESNVDAECSVEQATVSSPKEELSTNNEQNEHSSSSEVRGTQHSEDAVNEVHVEEVNPTEMQEIHLIAYSSESGIHNTTENSEIFTNLTDRAEVSDTYQSELSVTSVDDSATTQTEVSNPDGEQDEHPTKESNVEAFDQINEYYHVNETKKPQTTDTERADTSLGQVYEGEGQLENDIKSTAEQTSHQEKEGLLSEMEESKASLQSLQSETNAPLESQDTNTVINPIGNRRKLGSSRRKKGREHVKDSISELHHEPTEEDVDDIKGNEAFKTRSLTSLTTSQEELTQEREHDIMSVTYDNSLYPASTPDYSSEVQNPTTTNYLGTDPESLIPKSENLQEVHDERETDFKVEESDQLVDATLEGMDESDTLQSEEDNSTLYSEDTLNEVHEQEVNPTQIQKSHESDSFFESVIHTTAENADTYYGNLRDHEEVRDKHQPDLIVKSIDDPVTKQEVSDPDDTQDEYHTKESNVDAECSVEQATVSSPKEELSTNNEQNEHSSSSEVRGTQHSEDAVNEVHVEEVNPTEMQEIHLIAYSSESGIHNTTENSEIFTNLTDRAEVSDTYQSELSVTSVDDSATTQTEVSNPDGEQDEHPTKESNVEAFDQINEYYHVNETKKPQTTDTERADASLGQVYEGEGQLENDIKSTAEQTSHQEKEGLLSEMEESKASLQSLQSETNVPLESQDTIINPIGNRRKLGSSRRKKGQEHVKDSISELHHEPTEEDVDDIKGNEAFKTRSLTSLTTSQEELSQEREHDIMSVTYDNSLYPASTPDYSSEVQNPTTTTNYLGTDPESLIPKSENLQEVHDERETDFKVEESDQLVDATLEGMNESDTLQSEEDNSTLYSEDTVNEVHEQEVNPTQIQKSHESDSFFESVIHTTAENADTYYGNLRDHEEVRDKHQPDLTVKSIDDPVTKQEVSDPDDTQDEYHTKESNVDAECSVEQATVSSPKEELSTNNEQNEHSSSSEVRGTQHSEDAVNEVHVEEVNPTEMQEIHLISYSSESGIHNTTENSEIFTNLTDRAEVSDTYQSELSVTSFDDSATTQEVSNPDDEQDEHPTKESNEEAFDQINEYYHVNETKKPQTTDTERADTSLGQVYEGEGQLENDIKSTAEQTSHQEKEGLLSEMEESKASLQSLQSETNALLESQDTDTVINPIGNRRKLGSSRRKKGREHVKDSVAESHHKPTEEDVEDIRSNEALKTRSLTSLTTSQEELTEEREHDIMSVTYDNSLYQASMPDYSSEVQNLATTSNPETDLESLIPKNENLQEVHDERETDFKVEESDQLVDATLEGMDESYTLQSEEVNSTLYSVDTVNEVDEQEVNPTQMQKSHESDSFFESVIHDTAENSDTCYGNLRDHEEVRDKHQPDLSVKITDDSATMQEVSNPDDKPDEHPTKESNVEAFDQIHENYHVYDTKKPQTSDRERADSFLGQVYEGEGQIENDIKSTAEQTGHQEKEGLSSEMEESKASLQSLQSDTNAPGDLQPKDTSVKTDEQKDTDTDINPIGNRRKLGSSRRKKGREHVKDSVAESHHKPTEEDVEDIRSNEALKTRLLTSLTTSQEELTQKREHDIMSVTYDNSLYPMSPSEVKNPATANYPETDLESDDIEKPQSSDIVRAGIALGQVYKNEGQVEHDIKPPAEQTGHQEREGLLSEMEESAFSPQTLQSETTTPLDSQPQDNSVKIDEQKDTNHNPTGNRRKLGSSRRNKGQQHVKDSVAESHHKPTEDVVQNTMDDKPLETTKMSLMNETAVQETAMEIMLEGNDQLVPSQTEDVNDEVKKLTSVSVHSSPTVDQQVIDQSNVWEMPDEEPPSVYSVTNTESRERDEDTELLRQWGILQANNLVGEPHVKSVDVKSPMTLEISTEKSSLGQHTEYSVEQATVSSPKEELSINEEQSEHVSLYEVRGAQHSDNAVHEMHEEEELNPTEMEKMHQMDYTSVKESKSEIKSPLDSQPMDNSQSIKEETHSSFKPTGNRRKLGSSRRNKGRQHVPFSITEPSPELKEEAEEVDEVSKTEEIPDFKPAEKIRKFRTTNTEKMPEDISTITPRSDKDDFLKSTEEVNEEEKKHTEELENLTPLTGYDTDKIDLIQSAEATVGKDDSDTQNISYHDDNTNTRLVTSGDQEEAFQVQNSLGQEIYVQQIKYMKETEGDVTVKDYSTEAERSMDAQGPGQDEVKKEGEDPANKYYAAMPMDVSEQSGISSAGDASNSQQDMQENTPVDNSENLQGKFKQKRRKLGSTRRTQLNRKQEGEMDNKDETKESNLDMEVYVTNVDRVEVVEELPLIQGNTSDLQNTQRNMISVTDDSVARLPALSASHNEEVVSPVTFVHGADARDGEGNVDVSVKSPQPDDFTSTEMQTTSVATRRHRRSVNQLPPPNTEGAINTDSGITGSFGETVQSTQNDEQSPQGIKEIQEQGLKSTEAPSVAVAEVGKVKSVVRGGAGEEHKNDEQSTEEPNNVNEGAHNTNVEMKNASPNFSATNRRRKLGSSRRNLVLRTKGEDLNQKQEVDNEETATSVGDISTESVSGIEEKVPQLQDEHKDSDSEEKKEKVLETVEYSYAGESQSEPLTHRTVEENPPSQPVEPEHQQAPHDLPAKPSTSPKRDVMSETAAGGRRRKLGSSRKSHGHQNFEEQTATEVRMRDVSSLTDESAIRTTEEHREGSLGLDKISEVDERDEKPLSNISILKATEHSRPVSVAPKPVTPVQDPYTEIRLGRESLNKVSLGDLTGANARSKGYNVLMVGDSSVGKTSFMKRAQSGKFSLDIPASVGLDSCKWTVVVDGKPVVLHLWDTAGQERFRSITRQVFHKAQAFLLMYDITSPQSFSAISYWANCIQEGAAENVTVLLLGNKSDHAERKVKTQEGESLAKEYNFEFMECSAATGENVIHSLETVARMLSQKLDTREEAVVLHKEPPQRKRSGCC